MSVTGLQYNVIYKIGGGLDLACGPEFGNP